MNYTQKIIRAVIVVTALLSGCNCSRRSWRHIDYGINITAAIQDLLTGYDPNVRPQYGNGPVIVRVSLYVFHIHNIDDKQMEFTSELLLIQSWKDERLIGRPRPAINLIHLTDQSAHKIWSPDSYFGNAVRGHVPDINVYTTVNQYGEVTKSQRISVTASCPMKHLHFPLDHQICNLDLESYANSESDIKYIWKDANALSVSNKLDAHNFHIDALKAVTEQVTHHKGTHSRLSCMILLIRKVGGYVAHLYVPAIVAVLMSFVTFWFDAHSATLRLFLSTSAMLICLLDVWISPIMSSVTMLDVYLLVCTLMTTCVLAANIVCLRKRSEKTNLDPHKNHQSEQDLQKKKSTWQGFNREKFGRVFFPAIFVLFNVIYWVYVVISAKPTNNFE